MDDQEIVKSDTGTHSSTATTVLSDAPLLVKQFTELMQEFLQLQQRSEENRGNTPETKAPETLSSRGTLR
jgi:hypothetical protein